MILLLFIGLALHFALMALRLDNIGKGRWWIAMAFVPFLNLYVIALLIIVPAGYHYHKNLDAAGGAIVAAIATHSRHHCSNIFG